MYRVRAEISIDGTNWEHYDTTINSTRATDDMPNPDELVKDIQHHVAQTRGKTNTDVSVKNIIVSAPE